MPKTLKKIIFFIFLISLFFIPTFKGAFVYGADTDPIMKALNITEDSAKIEVSNIANQGFKELRIWEGEITNTNTPYKFKIDTHPTMKLGYLNLTSETLKKDKNYTAEADVINTAGQEVTIKAIYFKTKTGPCKITSAYFTDDGGIKRGNMGLTWYKSDLKERQKIKIIAETENCEGDDIRIFVAQLVGRDIPSLKSNCDESDFGIPPADNHILDSHQNPLTGDVWDCLLDADPVNAGLEGTNIIVYKPMRDSQYSRIQGGKINLNVSEINSSLDSKKSLIVAEQNGNNIKITLGQIYPGESDCSAPVSDPYECGYSLITVDKQTSNDNGVKVWKSTTMKEKDVPRSAALLTYECNTFLGEASGVINGIPIPASCTEKWAVNLSGPQTDILVPSEDYTFLAPIPGFPATIDTNTQTFSTYFNTLFKVAIGIAGVLAVLMIIFAGIKYMLADATPFKKEEAKSQISNAIIGLILLLGSVFMINLIDPSILNLGFTNVGTATLTIDPSNEPEFGIAESTVQLTKKNGEKITLKNCDETQMQSVTVFGHTIKIYKGLAESLKRIDLAKKTSADKSVKDYQITEFGGYVCRHVVNQPKYWSSHAFGTAIDINWNKNPYKPTELVSDIPKGLVDLFKKEGWGWGGDWSTPKDPMHFSKQPPIEKGNGIVE